MCLFICTCEYVYVNYHRMYVTNIVEMGSVYMYFTSNSGFYQSGCGMVHIVEKIVENYNYLDYC